MNLFDMMQSASVWGDTLEPQIKVSTNYKHWVSIEDVKRCVLCEENHGKIYLNHEQLNTKSVEYGTKLILTIKMVSETHDELYGLMMV